MEVPTRERWATEHFTVNPELSKNSRTNGRPGDSITSSLAASARPPSAWPTAPTAQNPSNYHSQIEGAGERLGNVPFNNRRPTKPSSPRLPPGSARQGTTGLAARQWKAITDSGGRTTPMTPPANSPSRRGARGKGLADGPSAANTEPCFGRPLAGAIGGEDAEAAIATAPRPGGRASAWKRTPDVATGYFNGGKS